MNLKPTLSDIAVNWYDSEVQNINTTAELKSAFLKRFNEWGQNRRELNDAWSKLKFEPTKREIEAYAYDVQLLGEMAGKTLDERIDKFKDSFSPEIEAHLTDNTWDALVRHARDLHMLFAKQEKEAATSTPNTAAAVLAHIAPASKPETQTPGTPSSTNSQGQFPSNQGNNNYRGRGNNRYRGRGNKYRGRGRGRNNNNNNNYQHNQDAYAQSAPQQYLPSNQGYNNNQGYGNNNNYSSQGRNSADGANRNNCGRGYYYDRGRGRGRGQSNRNGNTGHQLTPQVDQFMQQMRRAAYGYTPDYQPHPTIRYRQGIPFCTVCRTMHHDAQPCSTNIQLPPANAAFNDTHGASQGVPPPGYTQPPTPNVPPATGALPPDNLAQTQGQPFQ